MGYKAVVQGRGGIVARLLNKSVSEDGVFMYSFEIEYPRFIHSELMTHRMLSKNAASSRAIPIAKTIEAIKNNPAMPVEWGSNKPGMQAGEEIENAQLAKWLWHSAAIQASERGEVLAALDLHKQVVNRILEPYVFMKTIISGTEWNNFFSLRDHPDADPTIAELAGCMRQASLGAFAKLLVPSEWHFAYVDTDVGFDRTTYTIDGEEIDLETAKKIDAACCAQVSFRKLDTSIEKALCIYERLAGSTPIHASPFEHQATPIDGMLMVNGCFGNLPSDPDSWEDGVTHADRKGNLWSGNLRGWIQQRQLISGNYVEG